MSNTPPTSVKLTGLLLSVLTITLVASQPQKALSEDTSKSGKTIDTVCSSLTAAEKDAVLKVHNDARIKAGLKEAEKVTWNCDLAKGAQQWANDKRSITPSNGNSLTHSNAPGVGENIAAQSAWPKVTRSVDSLASGWVQEGTRFDLKKNTCSGTDTCGHYTQVVWRTTKQVGCGVKIFPLPERELTASNGQVIKLTGEQKVLVCQYSPAGNDGQNPILAK